MQICTPGILPHTRVVHQRPPWQGTTLPTHGMGLQAQACCHLAPTAAAGGGSWRVLCSSVLVEAVWCSALALCGAVRGGSAAEEVHVNQGCYLFWW
jgi:hypothetical protein